MLFFFGDVHLFSHGLTERFFDHTHWWLHAVVHIVLVGGPLAFGLVFAAPGWRLARAACRLVRGNGTLRARTAEERSGAFSQGLVRFVLRRTWRAQIWLLLGAAAAMPALYATLELPKRIINEAMATSRVPIALGGVEIGQIGYLLILCFLFLAAVSLHGVLKYQLNLAKGRVGEGLVRLLRLSIHREWRRRGRPGGASRLIPVVIQEVEPVGGFAGDLLAVPLFQGGTFVTILAFMIAQDPVLGAAALTLLPLQIFLLPRLQRKVNALGRERLKEIRQLGHLIGEGGPESLRPVHRSFRRVQEIRYEIYRRKFMMKGLSNFISHMTPFFFYTIGGYLVIEGSLSLGALVAVLTAYKDCSAPLRELFGYYQRSQDIGIRYEEIRLYLSSPNRREADPQPAAACPADGVSASEASAVAAPPGRVLNLLQKR